jgi:methylthioribose-1-phosphate isomerase
MSDSNNLQSLRYSGGDNPTLAVLDQLLIPQEKQYIDIPDVEAAWGVIRTMQIRGTSVHDGVSIRLVCPVFLSLVGFLEYLSLFLI